MWWFLATALAGSAADQSLAVVLDETASTRSRMRAAKELGRLDPSSDEAQRAVTALAGTLQAELPANLPEAIRKTLVRLGATQVWTRELGSADVPTRRRAADLLGQEGNREAGPALVAQLEDPDASVREAVAGALGGYPAAGAVAPLILRLQDTSIGVRLAASQSLGFLGGEEAAKGLAKARIIEQDRVVQHYLDVALQHIRGQSRP
ncbi:MAG: HEAT repeat domain-containing protein [Myxococcota bacterium]